MTHNSNDMELVTWNYIRKEYENRYDRQHIPLSLKFIVVKFAKRIIGCKLLSIKEDLDFYQMLLKKLSSNIKFKLLFRASEHQYLAKKFHEKCDNQGATLTIIQSNWGNIFGGYVSKSWNHDKNYTQTEDKNAFLFVIKSDDKSVKDQLPMTFSLTTHHGYAIFNDSLGGPCFGGHDICIRDKCNRTISHLQDANYCYPYSYNTSGITNLCGGSLTKRYDVERFLFQVVNYEVFNVQ